MTITVASLHKKLADLIAAGHGRKPVCINKESFTHPLENDGAVILGIESVKGPEWVGTCDDDGGIKVNADGSEAGRMTVILQGGAE